MKAAGVKQTECEGQATSDVTNLFQASCLKREIKLFSVATHLARGVILNMRKNLRRGTTVSMKQFL